MTELTDAPGRHRKDVRAVGHHSFVIVRSAVVFLGADQERLLVGYAGPIFDVFS